MDGVLILDWILSGPSAWRHPIEFATRQYSHFPTLGIGRAYPPGVALFQAAFFAVFGVSAMVSRLCVASFGVAAVIGVFVVTRRWLSHRGAMCAGAALLAIPSVVLWTRQTMLEMPALAVLIWLTHSMQRYVENPTPRRWLWMVLLTVAAPMFKQTAVFIVPLVAFVLAVHAFHSRVAWRGVGGWALLAGVPIGLLFAFTWWSSSGLTHMWQLVSDGHPAREWFRWESLSFFVRTLPEQAGWIPLAIAAVGLAFCLRRHHWPAVMTLSWFVLFLLMVTCIQHKQPRYFFFGFFPIAVWCGYAADQWRLLTRHRLAATTAWIGLWTALLIRAYATPVPYQPDYRELVDTFGDRIRGRMVFFEGRRDGDFIFAVRERLGPRSAVVVRGSKLLYSCAADARWRFTSYVSSVEQVSERIRPFGFAALLVERDNVTGVPEVDLLHEYLRTSGDYRRATTLTLHSGTPKDPGMTRVVDVYLPTNPAQRTLRYMDIPIPIAGEAVRVDLDELMADLAKRASEG